MDTKYFVSFEEIFEIPLIYAQIEKFRSIIPKISIKFGIVFRILLFLQQNLKP